MTTEESRTKTARVRARLARLLLKVGMLTVSVCLALVIADYAIYEHGYGLLARAPAKRDLFLSQGISRRDRHPLYLAEIRGFFPPQSGTWTAVGSGYGDIYSALNLKQPVYGNQAMERVGWPKADAIGWLNTNELQDSQVLFVGDSFVRGNGAGFGGSMAVHYERITGLRTYAAANEGFGLQQYRDIVGLLLRKLGANARGRTVYVVLCLENDFSFDFERYTQGVKDERASHTLRFRACRHLGLKSVKAVLAMSMATLRMKAQSIQNPGLSDGKTQDSGAAGQTSSSIAGSSERDHLGWFPVSVDLPLYRDAPFAFFRAHYTRFAETGWFDERRKEIDDVFREFRSLSAEHGVAIRFILLPATLEVVNERIVETSVKGEFASVRGNAVAGMARVRGEILGMLKSEEVLDMLPVMKGAITNEALVWPGDIHYTSKGYEAVARAAARKWNDLK